MLKTKVRMCDTMKIRGVRELNLFNEVYILLTTKTVLI